MKDPILEFSSISVVYDYINSLQSNTPSVRDECDISSYQINHFQVGQGASSVVEASSVISLGAPLTDEEYGGVLRSVDVTSATLYIREGVPFTDQDFVSITNQGQLGTSSLVSVVFLDEQTANGTTINEVGLFVDNPFLVQGQASQLEQAPTNNPNQLGFAPNSPSNSTVDTSPREEPGHLLAAYRHITPIQKEDYFSLMIRWTLNFTEDRSPFVPTVTTTTQTMTSVTSTTSTTATTASTTTPITSTSTITTSTITTSTTTATTIATTAATTIATTVATTIATTLSTTTAATTAATTTTALQTPWFVYQDTSGNDVLTIYAIPTADSGVSAGANGNAIYHGLSRSGARGGPYAYAIKLFNSLSTPTAGVGIATYQGVNGTNPIASLVGVINANTNYHLIRAIFHNETEDVYSDPNTYANATQFTNGSGG